MLKSVEIKQKILSSILDFSIHIDEHKKSAQYSLEQISEMLALAIEVNNLINALDKADPRVKLPDLDLIELKKIQRVLELFFKYKSDLNSISIDIGENLSSTNRFLHKGVDFIFENLSKKDFRQTGQAINKPRTPIKKAPVQTQKIRKKKASSLGLIAPLMFLIVVFVAGFSVYNFFFDKSATRVSSLVKEYRSDRDLSSVTRAKIGKDIEVYGTNSILNVLRDNQALFRAKYSQITLNIVGGDSGEAISDLVLGKVNLAASSKIPTVNDRKRAIKNGKPISDHKIALDSVVVFTHKSNLVEMLSIEDLKQIYSGKISNWQLLGGHNQEIKKFSLSKQSGTYAFFMDRVMFSQAMVENVVHVYNPIQMMDLIAADPSAIGFSSLSAVKGSKQVKVIKIASIFDEEGTSPLDSSGEINSDVIKRGEYPLTRYLYLVSSGAIADEVAKVIDFMRSESIQAKLPDYGLVSIL